MAEMMDMLRDPLFQDAAVLLLLAVLIGYLVFCVIRGLLRSGNRPAVDQLKTSNEEIVRLRAQVAELSQSVAKVAEKLDKENK